MIKEHTQEQFEYEISKESFKLYDKLINEYKDLASVHFILMASLFLSTVNLTEEISEMKRMSNDTYKFLIDNINNIELENFSLNFTDEKLS